jgi:hypothetical protein
VPSVVFKPKDCATSSISPGDELCELREEVVCRECIAGAPEGECRQTIRARRATDAEVRTRGRRHDPAAAEAKEIELRIELPRQPCVINGDDRRIKQVGVKGSIEELGSS